MEEFVFVFFSCIHESSHFVICSSVALRELFSFLFVLINYFNWRIITLQFCHGFAYVNMTQPQVYMCPPILNPHLPPSPLYHSGLSQSTDFGCPTSCIELALDICFTYGNIHVSMLFSQIIPPLPSPTESKSLFFTSVSLLLSHI